MTDQPTIHKADPIDDETPSTCKHCRGVVKRVPGGNGPVWVHEDGHVVGRGAPKGDA